MAPAIVRAMGLHTAFWEPFCGSMAVLMNKPPCRAETVNDLHGDLVNLARVVRHPRLGPALYRRLRRVLFSEAGFREAAAAVRSGPPPADGDPDLDRAEAYFTASWMGMNGVAGTERPSATFSRRFTSGGGDPAARWAGAVWSIPGWRRRMERVTVLSGDGVELCRKIEDRAGTVVYCDPPYLVKSNKYLHDFGADDHARLAAALDRFRATRVVISYYDGPELGGLYPGWHRRPVAASKGLANGGKRDATGRTDAPEILLSNLPFPGEPAEGESLIASFEREADRG